MKLVDEAASHGITPPTAKTLNRYGLRQSDWLRILKRQGWACAICRVGGDALYNIDHEHYPGWSKMLYAERSKFVRGILCFRCNKYNAPSRNFTTEMAANLAKYIRNYERRRDRATHKR